MAIFYVLPVGMFIFLIKGSIAAVKRKEYGELLSLILAFPFLFFAVVSGALGGSAFHDAQSDYE